MLIFLLNYVESLIPDRATDVRYFRSPAKVSPMNVYCKKTTLTRAPKGINRAIFLKLACKDIRRLVLLARNPVRLPETDLMGKIVDLAASIYLATKLALLGFAQALHSKLAGNNERVIELLPSPTRTDIESDFAWYKWEVPVTSKVDARAFRRTLQQEPPGLLLCY